MIMRTAREASAYAMFALCICIFGACGNPAPPGIGSCETDDNCSSEDISSPVDMLAEASDNGADASVPKTDADSGVETTSSDGADSANGEAEEDTGVDADSSDGDDLAEADGGEAEEDTSDAIDANETEVSIDGGDNADGDDTDEVEVSGDIDSADAMDASDDGATDDAETESVDSEEADGGEEEEDASDSEADEDAAQEIATDANDTAPELPACVTGIGACEDKDPCTTDWCDYTIGCLHAPNSTEKCDDANLCTIKDTCVNGVCVGGPAPNCNDANPCTTDSCDKATGCVNAPNTASCDDGNACTKGDTCKSGVCTAGAPIVCNDSNVCTDDSCDPATGCIYTPNTASCDGGSVCWLAYGCQNGSCVGSSPLDCDDGNQCSLDVCNKTIGCLHSKQTGTPCNDGNACTTVDTCASGACTGNTPPNCDDANACTLDSCDNVKGCQHTDTSASCSDGNVCTDDSCEPSKGCVFVNNTKPCDDKSVCTTVDTCAGGVCVGGSPKSCDDGNLCTDDSCDTLKDCQHANNTAVCDDANQCTDPDACASGTCKGTPKADGAACDDGKSCNVDSCQSGLCVGAPFASANFDTDGQPPAGWTAFSAAGVTYNGSQGYTSKPNALFSHNNVGGSANMTVTSPAFALLKGNTAVVQFDILNIGGTNSKLTTVILNCGSSQTVLYSKNGPQGSDWLHFAYALDSFEGVCSLKFSVNGGMGPLGLDSIVIGCP